MPEGGMGFVTEDAESEKDETLNSGEKNMEEKCGI